MRTSFFIPQKRYTFMKNPFRAAAAPLPAAVDPVHAPPRRNTRPPTELHTLHTAQKGVCIVSILLAVLLLSVFREIQHTRELYKMSRMVTLAEAERRQWQERWRLAEGRTAGLLAAMHGQSAPSRDVQVIPASHVIRTRRR